MDGWSNGWLDNQIEEGMGVLFRGWSDGCLNGQVVGWLDRRMDGWCMNGQMDGRLDGQLDRWDCMNSWMFRWMVGLGDDFGFQRLGKQDKGDDSEAFYFAIILLFSVINLLHSFFKACTFKPFLKAQIRLLKTVLCGQRFSLPWFKIKTKLRFQRQIIIEFKSLLHLTIYSNTTSWAALCLVVFSRLWKCTNITT